MYLFIDPSIHSMGVAYFTSMNANQLQANCYPNNIFTKLITSNNKDWKKSAHEQIFKLKTFANGLVIKEVYIEYPQFWGSGSLASISSGSLPKLFFMCGMIVEVFHNKVIPTTLVTPNQWKGQLNKDQVINIICKRIGISKKEYKLDEWDAVGIGLWKAGLL